MATIINIDEFKKDRAIELGDGTVLDIPVRSAENYEALVEIEKKHNTTKEYDYYKAVLELFFGKEGFKKIARNGKKTNLDYIAYVSITAQELFLADKIEAEKAEISKKAEMLEPITSQMKNLSPIANKLK